MDTWQPQTIRRFIKGFPSSAHPALVETDLGLGYLKAMGGPEGPHTLAAEVVATQLAAWLGLPTFDWNIIRVDEIDEIPFLDKDGNQTGKAAPGPAFITRAEKGTTWSGGSRELKMLKNPDDISRLVVFDTWVLNCDRHSPPVPRANRRRKPNRDNVFLSEEAPAGQFVLTAMDHTHCFTCGGEWTRRLGHVDTIRDTRVFGVFPEFRKLLRREVIAQVASDLEAISSSNFDEVIRKIPNEWEVSLAVRDALAEFIVSRAGFLATRIESLLFPQGSLFSESEDGSE